MTTAALEWAPAGSAYAGFYGPDQEHPYGLDEFNRLIRRARRALTVARPVRGSTWIQENLSLDSKTSPDAVNRVKLFGYQLEMADAYCDTTIPRVVVPKSARVGHSLVTTAAAAYLLAHEAAPVAYVTQNEAKAQEWLKTNFNPLFKHPDNKVLSRIVRVHRKGEDMDELLDRYYANGALFRGRSAASDDSFRGYRAKRMFCDEVDAKTWQGLKDSQGDKIELALDRTAEYFDGGIVLGGTPVHLHSSLVWPNWLRTDQRKYFVPCPHCTGAVGLHPARRDKVNFEMDVDKPEVSGFQFLEFGDANTTYGIKWDTPDNNQPVTRAYYQCRHCGSEIDEYEADSGYSWKAWMDRHGEWRPTNGKWRRGDRPGHWIAIESDAEPGWRGYHVWAAYSCTPGVTWLKIARTFLNAVKRGGRALQNFENTWKGLPWEARMSFHVPKASALAKMTVNYPGHCPDDVIGITLTGDVQLGTADGAKKPRLEMQVVGFGRRDTAYVLDYLVLDKYLPWTPQAEQILDEIRRRVFVTPSGRRIPIMATGIDRSFQPESVLNYCSPTWRRRERVFAIRGDAAESGRPKESMVSKAPSRDSKNRPWFTVDRILTNSLFFEKLQRGPTLGGIVIPRSLAYFPGYLEGLLAEKPVQLENGNTVYKHTKSIPNESFDTLCYALALWDIVKNMVKGYADNDIDKLADAMGVPATMTVFDSIEEDRSILAPVVADMAREQQIPDMPTVDAHAKVEVPVAPASRFRPARELSSPRQQKLEPAAAPAQQRLRGGVVIKPSNGGFGRPNWGRR